MLQHAQTFQMQQQQQQQQQVQQDGHQNMQPFPDQARMWAMQQMSNQFRPQNPSELNNAQASRLSSNPRGLSTAVVPSSTRAAFLGLCANILLLF